MKLDEILKSAVAYDVKAENQYTFKTSSHIGDREITFSAHYEDGEDYWEIVFEEITKHGSTYASTGNGHEFRVLAMVRASIAEFVDRYHPRVIHFSAESVTRGNVYRKMVAPVLKNYEAYEQQSGNYVLFTYTRKD